MNYEATPSEEYTRKVVKEKFVRDPHQATDTELLSILLDGVRKRSPMDMAIEIYAKFDPKDGINGYEDIDYRDFLQDIEGMSAKKAIELCAAIEFGRRMSFRYDRRKLTSFNAPDKVAEFFMEKLRHENQEHFIVAYVNVKNRLLGYREITKGNLNAAPVDIKETMKWAIRYKAYGLILVHNHPSGYPEPSKEDISVTKAFAEAAKLLDMQVLDHIIIGDGTFVSLHERGCL